MVSTSSSLS